MLAKEIREKTNEELLQEIDTLKDELFNLRFQQATGQLENTARLKTVKKTIARIKTVLTERENAGQGVGRTYLMERNARKVYRGTVVSDKMDKTITVMVETKKTHPLYGKRVKYSKKFKAHDENNEARIGDKVVIMETRPLSATKRFRLVEIVEKARG